MTIVAGLQFVASEYLQILSEEDLSSLQRQECDLMARLLQTTDRMINMKLRGMRFTKSDAAFLVNVGNFQAVFAPEFFQLLTFICIYGSDQFLDIEEIAAGEGGYI